MKKRDSRSYICCFRISTQTESASSWIHYKNIQPNWLCIFQLRQPSISLAAKDFVTFKNVANMRDIVSFCKVFTRIAANLVSHILCGLHLWCFNGTKFLAEGFRELAHQRVHYAYFCVRVLASLLHNSMLGQRFFFSIFIKTFDIECPDDNSN